MESNAKLETVCSVCWNAWQGAQTQLSFYSDISTLWEPGVHPGTQTCFWQLNRRLYMKWTRSITSLRCNSRDRQLGMLSSSWIRKNTLSTISTTIPGPHLLQGLETSNETQASSTKQHLFYQVISCWFGSFSFYVFFKRKGKANQ